MGGGIKHSFRSKRSSVTRRNSFAPSSRFSALKLYSMEPPYDGTQWSHVCKNTTSRLYATAECHCCGTPRSLSMRLLNDVGRILNDFQCAVVGLYVGKNQTGFMTATLIFYLLLLPDLLPPLIFPPPYTPTCISLPSPSPHHPSPVPIPFSFSTCQTLPLPIPVSSWAYLLVHQGIPATLVLFLLSSTYLVGSKTGA